MSSQESFESADYLTAWTDSQLKKLEVCLQPVINHSATTMVKEFNFKTEQDEIKLKFTPPPFEARGLASNIIKDLRDALDQVTHGASLHVLGGAGRNAKKLHFPFASDPTDFDTAITKNQSKQIPHELHSIIKSYEPYPTGEGYSGGNNSLRLLGKISGSHKHRNSLVTTVQPNEIGIQLKGIGLGFGPKGGSMFSGAGNEPPENNEIILFSFSPGSYAEFDVEATSYVAFSHPELRRIPALTFLRECQFSVSNIVQDLRAKALAISPRC